jgi:hypothetical protein
MALKTFSTNYLAIEFGIDRAAATRMLQAVEPDAMERDQPRYLTATFARTLELHHAAAAATNNDSAANGGDTSATAALTMARVRIANASAEAKERQNQQAAGLLVPIKPIADAIGVVLTVVRENLLGLPGKVADELSAYSALDRGLIAEKLKKEIWEHVAGVQKGFADIVTRVSERGLASLAEGKKSIEDDNKDTSHDQDKATA